MSEMIRLTYTDRHGNHTTYPIPENLEHLGLFKELGLTATLSYRVLVHPELPKHLGCEFTEQQLREFAATLRQPTVKTVETVRCDCGHTVARNLVMSTSRGTSCPDCYDRMSD